MDISFTPAAEPAAVADAGTAVEGDASNLPST